MSKIKIQIENKSEPNKKTSSEVKFLSGIKVKNRQELKRKVGDFIKESVLDSVGGASSPVAGEKWPTLSKKYKDRKRGRGSLKANLELSGDMLDAYDYKLTEQGVEPGVFGSKQGEKADGHNKLTGRTNNTPKRRFVPGTGQKFKAEIQDGIRGIVSEHIIEQEEESVSDDFEELSFEKSALNFTKVKTQKQFNKVVSARFPLLTVFEAKRAIKNTPSLFDLLQELGLLSFLGG